MVSSVCDPGMELEQTVRGKSMERVQTSILTPSFSLCAASFAGVLVLGATTDTSSLVAFATSLLRGGMVPCAECDGAGLEKCWDMGVYRRIGRAAVLARELFIYIGVFGW